MARRAGISLAIAASLRRDIVRQHLHYSWLLCAPFHCINPGRARVSYFFPESLIAHRDWMPSGVGHAGQE